MKMFLSRQSCTTLLVFPWTVVLRRSYWLWPHFRFLSSCWDSASPNSTVGRSSKLASLGSLPIACQITSHCCCNFFSASEDYGKSFEDVTNLINNTFISAEFGIAIGPENSGKVSHILFFATTSSGCFWLVQTEPLQWCLNSNIWTLAFRWSWRLKSLEEMGIGFLSPVTLGRLLPTWTCLSNPWCRSHTTLRTPMCWQSSAWG